MRIESSDCRFFSSQEFCSTVGMLDVDTCLEK
jgi:hypothetical protein